jgi:hypothetical protein
MPVFVCRVSIERVVFKGGSSMLTGLIGRRLRAHFGCGWLKKTVPRALCFSVGHPIFFFGSRAVGSGRLFPFPDPSIHDLH